MKHGWFAIEGVQTGEHSLYQRLRGVEQLADFTEGATILDIGCAEGFIGAWLVEQDGKLLHGVDKHKPYLETARAQYAHQPRYTFFERDVNEIGWHKGLLKNYDIVLCLCLAHKLQHPLTFLSTAAMLCNKFFALHLPADIINDPRSGRVKLDPNIVFGPPGFDCIVHDVDEKLSRRIYRRREADEVNHQEGSA